MKKNKAIEKKKIELVKEEKEKARERKQKKEKAKQGNEKRREKKKQASDGQNKDKTIPMGSIHRTMQDKAETKIKGKK